MPGLPEHYNDTQNVYIITDVCAGGELHDIVKEHAEEQRPLNEKWIARVFHQTLEAIAYFQAKGFLHKDLKFKDDEGNDITMEIAHPCAMLYHVSLVSASFSAIVLRTAQHTPPTLTEPWHIILYTDEILPGNQLAYKSRRKMWAVYWSVLEFGAAILK